jgi:hypothetical protein
LAGGPRSRLWTAAEGGDQVPVEGALVDLAGFGVARSECEVEGGVIAVGARCKNTLRRRLMVFPIAWLGIMTPIPGNKLFPGSTGSTIADGLVLDRCPRHRISGHLRLFPQSLTARN